MVLVEHEAVVAELVGEDHLRHVARIQVVAALWVVVGVGEVDPQGLVVSVVGGQMGVREEVEVVELRFVDDAHGCTMTSGVVRSW